MDPQRKQRLPPASVVLPSNSNTGQDNKKTVSEDGRVRSYPYQRGQWATFPFVYLPEDVFQDYLEVIESYDKIKRIANNDIHLSIIRGHYTLRYHQISLFVSTLSQRLSLITSFMVCLSEFKLFKNDEKTRCFICISQFTNLLNQSKAESLLNCIKSVLNEFNSKVSCTQTDPIDDEFIFHSSLAWCLPEDESIAQDLIKQLNSMKEPILIKVEQIKVKIGDQLHTFNLRNETNLKSAK